MAKKFVVDTHALIWFLAGNRRLSLSAEKILQNETSELVLPAIVLAEACWIVQHKEVQLSPKELLEAIDADTRFTVFPFGRDVIEQSLDLHSIHEMHDRLIVATALTVARQGHSCAMLTCDENIVSSQLIPTIW